MEKHQHGDYLLLSAVGWGRICITAVPPATSVGFPRGR